MARPRLELQSVLETILSEFVDDGLQRVWFQPPSTVHLNYPCILYDLSAKDFLHANNGKYRAMNKYTVTIIDRDPESLIPDRIEELPYSSFDRRYASDSLWHTVYTLYF